MEDPMMFFLSSVFSLCLLSLLLRFLHRFWWTPVSIQNRLRSQGIKGPSYRFIHGNNKEILEMRTEALRKPLGLADDIVPRVLPHVHTWKNMYGKNYLSWRGGQAQLAITELELIKEVLNNRDKVYQKAPPPFYIKKVMGNGLATSVGERWVKHRRLINHAFQGDCLKKMMPEMIVSVEMMLQSWEHHQGEEIEVFEEFRLLTSDIISRTAFGSSYLEGKNIFDMTKRYSDIIRRNAFRIRLPGISEIWKTSDEIEADKLLRLMRDSVMEIVEKREEKVRLGDIGDFGNDFLGILLQAYHDVDENRRILVQDLIDECKTFYISGQETSNSLLSWTVLLLAIHSDWQDKAREEVIELFGHKNPHPKDLSKLNTITMIINEALRLYPPALVFVRKCEREVRLGKLVLPANLNLFISNLVVHRDPGIWGDDAHLFKPERFSAGVAKATSNNVAAYFPFGVGPRTCIGFNFATMVAKVVLVMILQRYRFTLSPAYVHSPVLHSLLVPQHGIQVILHTLQSEESDVTLKQCIGKRGAPIGLSSDLDQFWWTPIRIQYRLREQGIEGPSYGFIYGNAKEILKLRNEALSKPLGLSDDIFPRVLPHSYTWMNKYGENFLCWRGDQPQLSITEPELIKEVLYNRDKAYQNVPPSLYSLKLMGNGLVTSEGERWAKHRKLLNHAFQGECLKRMIPDMIVSVELMLQAWKHHQGKEIEVSEEFRLLTSDIISRTAFGNNYLEGKTIFDMMVKYSDIIKRNMFKVRFPGISKIWKTSDDIEMDKLLGVMHDSVVEIIKRREEKVKPGDIGSFGNDFLGLLLRAYYDVDENKRILVQDLIDECKTFYISGQATTSSLLSWTVLLLAIHADWQDKARAEVIELFGHRNPNTNDLSKLNTMTMIINETLRLYPPAIGILRNCESEVKLGKFTLPANLQLFIPSMAVHRDPGIWGDDAHLFKPERFSEGVAIATNNNVTSYFPFGIGPRTCIGFNFAISGAKIALTMILQRYRFVLSPAYVHSPVLNSLLVPQHGIQVILHPLQGEEGPC
ncbi:hypothetical protein V6N11_021236 [Hibiscus sabdariffa]|uniref:Cytochrome P450 n=1 Tax=Hibiscus sabdariffa TaxID=183260 RepID=A0ABR2NM59_9ROSI